VVLDQGKIVEQGEPITNCWLTAEVINISTIYSFQDTVLGMKIEAKSILAIFRKPI